jgi:hypothetical protein
MSVLTQPYFKFSIYQSQEMFLEEYKDWCKENKLVADEAFQANSVFKNSMGGTGRWGNKDAESYVFSLITGMAPSDFVFANNKACYDCAIEEDRISDAKYFEKWGVSHMVLDSWNRNENLGTTTIDDGKILLGFFNDKVKLYSGVYDVRDKDGIKQSVTISGDNNVYSKFPDLMKEHIKYHVKIRLVIYENLTRDECSVICRYVNLGVQWTPELFRNTITSDVAAAIRKLPVLYKSTLLEDGCKWFNPSQLSKRKADNFFAELYWMYNNDWTKKALVGNKVDEMYELGKLSQKDVNEISKCVNYFFDKVILKTKDEQFGAIQYLAFKNPIMLMHLFCMFVPYFKDGYEVLEKNLMPMYTAFMDAHTVLWDSKDKHEKRKSGANSLEEYKKLITGKQRVNVKICNRLLSEKFNIEDYLTKKGPRVVSDGAKEVLAHKQGMVTPEGKPIPADKLHTKNFHKGHGKEPYKDTLTSDINDTYVQAETDNKKQRANPIVLND